VIGPARGSVRRAPWLVVALALVVLAGAPRWTEGARAAAPARIPTDEYLARINKLCDDRYRALVRLGPFEIPLDYAQRGPKKIGLERDFHDAVDAVPRPVEDASMMRAIRRARAEFVASLGLLPRVVTAARRHQKKAWRLMYRAHAHADRAGEIARAHGATKCRGR
jgi:hypothetical protein